MQDFPGYDILEELYKGKLTRVIRARREDDGRPVVLKVLLDERRTDAQITRFDREFTLTRHLGERVTGVIEAYSLEEENGALVMCLEDFGGTSLAVMLRSGRWHRAQFPQVANRVVAALDEIHRLGVIHKDLNPSNILINPYTEDVRIIDFGIAVELGKSDALPAESGVEGTLAYLAPEQTGRVHREIDKRSDFYALGVCFYELLTGRLPFDSDNPMDLVHLHVTAEPQPPAALDSLIPVALSDLVLSMMAKNPEDRPGDAAELAVRLAAIPIAFTHEPTEIAEPGIATRLKSLSFTTSPTAQGTAKLWGDMLDYTALLESAQAISSEIVMGKLISRLMSVLLENAGAQRGALLLQSEVGMVVAAVGMNKDIRLTGDIPLDDAEATTMVPRSIIEHSLEMGVDIILEGEVRDPSFIDDPYFREHQPISILCTPILGQGETLGMIYLENSLVRGMFMRERLEMVRVLASQAAIAIANASLMNSLERSRAELARANADLERKVAERTEALRHANEVLAEEMAESERAQRVLMELARYGPKFYRKRLRQLLEACARTLEVERVSYWQVDEVVSPHAVREDLYVRSTDTHFDEGRELSDVVFPGFMDEVKNLEYLQIENVYESERTAAIAESYFAPKGIVSLLVVGVWRGGNLVGGLSLGHVGAPRKWKHTHIDFATAIGQLISLALEAEQRRYIERRLRLESEIPRSNPNPILRFDTEGRITYANPAAHELLHEPEGCMLVEVLPELEDISIEICIRDGEIIRRGGTIGDHFFQFELRGAPDLSIAQVYGFDITELHHTEAALRKSERELDAVFETTNDGILILRDEQPHRGNKRVLELFGFEDQAELGRASISEMWPRYQIDGNDSLISWKQMLTEARVSGNARFDWRFQRMDGTIFDAEVQLAPLLIETHAMMLATIHDISHRLTMEENLRRSEERRRYAVEGSRDGIWDWQIDKDEVFFSDRWKEILGYGPDEIPNRWEEWEARIHPDDLERVNEALQQTLTRERDTFHESYRMIAADDSIRWILTRARAVFNDSGEPIRLSGANTDITERNLAEERFRVLFRYSSDAHLLYDESGIIDCNAATLRELGFENKQEILARHPHELSPPHQPDGRSSREKAAEVEHTARKEGHLRFTWTFLASDGREFPAEVTLTPVSYTDRPSMLAVLHHAGGRERPGPIEHAHGHLLEMISSGRPLTSVLASLVDVVETSTEHGDCLLVVRGFDDEEPPRCISREQEQDPDQIGSIDWTALFLEHELVVGDREMGLSLSVLPEPDDAIECFWAVPILGIDGEIIGSFLLTFQSYRQPDPIERETLTRLARLAALAVGHHRQARVLARSHERAEAAKSAKVRFLSNMSHELRTPLNAILGFGQLLTRSGELSAEGTENMDVIIRSGEHLLSTINDILEMSRIESEGSRLNAESFDLFRLLADIERMFSLEVSRKGLYLELRRGSAVPRYIHTDPGKLRQILINLISNAIEHTERGGITVVATVLEEPEDLERTRLCFEVRDTGVGIARADQAGLFSPYVETERGRELQHGTGLGLAICHELVSFLGGEICVESALGKGATFTFTLPVRAVEAAPEGGRLPASRLVGIDSEHIPRVLVVDDHDQSRLLLRKLLQKIGFEIEEAINGEEALARVRNWRPDVVLMDVDMPIMDGIEAARRIKAGEAGEPIPKVLALEASTFTSDRAPTEDNGCDAVIDKPVGETELSENLAELLGIRYLEEPRLPLIDAEPDRRGLREPIEMPPMPEPLIAEIERATLLGDLSRLTELAEEVRCIDPATADLMLTHLDSFAYDALLHLIRGGTLDG